MKQIKASHLYYVPNYLTLTEVSKLAILFWHIKKLKFIIYKSKLIEIKYCNHESNPLVITLILKLEQTNKIRYCNHESPLVNTLVPKLN